MDNVIQVVCAWIFNADRTHVLLVKNTDRDFWGPPAGGVEKGEHLHPALIRETWEEAGLNVNVGPLVAVGEGFNPRKDHKVLFFSFLATPLDPEQAPSIQSPDEIAELRWVARAEVETYLHWLAFSPWDFLTTENVIVYPARIL